MPSCGGVAGVVGGSMAGKGGYVTTECGKEGGVAVMLAR